MDKPNVFRTSEFYMSEGDTLHVSIKYADGSDTVDLDLVAGDSGVVSDSTTYRVVDKDGNIYRTVIIGNQEWIIENWQCTKYADGTDILNVIENGFNDWFLPSRDELQEMYNELFLYGVGGFSSINYYWTSSEALPNAAYALEFTSGIMGLPSKSALNVRTRACRTFSGTAIDYPLRSTGQAGGLVFAHSGGLVYEASIDDLSNDQSWSNIGDTEIGITAQGTAIGTGQANTVAIIDQVGHINSAAKLCNDIKLGGWENNTVGAYCWYDNDIANKDDYGTLYNWYAVNNAAGLVHLTRNGIHEPDWRVPTNADWNDLVTSAGGRYVAGGRLKATGTAYWNSPNTGATDEYGFKGLPAGYRSWNGIFYSIKFLLYLWSSTEFSETRAIVRYLLNNAIDIRSDESLKEFGFSVRAVRDL